MFLWKEVLEVLCACGVKYFPSLQHSQQVKRGDAHAIFNIGAASP